MNTTLTLRAIIVGLAALAFLATTVSSTAAEQSGKIKVLLVTGDDVQPAHNWREVSQALRETLVSSGKFEVRVCEDAGVLDSAATLGRYDLVLLAMYNAKTPTLSDGAKENLASFVKDGKGLVDHAPVERLVQGMGRVSQALWPLLGDGQIRPQPALGVQGADYQDRKPDHAGSGRLRSR